VNIHIDIQNYKSVKHTNFHLKNGLNILIGPNGSGKTCILSALKFLRDVIHLGAAQALARSGGSKRVYHRGQNEISFTVSCDYGEKNFRRKKYPCTFFWDLKISQRGPEKIATIIYESLRIVITTNIKKHTIFEVIINRRSISKITHKVYLCPENDFSKDLFTFWKYEYSGKSKSHIRKEFRSTVSQIVSRIKKKHDKSIFPNINRFDDTITNLYLCFSAMNEYNILPDVARQSSEQLPFARMQPDGGCVSEVIHALKNRNFHKISTYSMYDPEDFVSYGPEYFRYYSLHKSFYRKTRYRHAKGPAYLLEQALERINTEIAAAVKPLESIDVDIDPTNGKRFVVFKSQGESFYPEEVSDGTMKWLCILVSIFVPDVRLYLLEEPENFLHPWMQQRLLDMMREQSKESGTLFILSSHSTTVLNSAFPEEILITRQSSTGTHLYELKDKKEVSMILSESDFRLGDLWVSGAIGGVPADE
jgi:predicted ATPase